MKGLVAGDVETAIQHARELLLHGGLDCPATCLVSLELAADRGSRLQPDVVVLLLSPDVERGCEALRDLRTTVPSYVVAAGPVSDPKLILRVLHDGADEYLDAERLDLDLPEALVRVKARQSPQAAAREPGHVIAVLGPSGGSGASTVSVNLAAVLAQHHGACGLADLRLAAGDLASLLDVKPAYSLGDFCENLDRIDRSMFEQFWTPHSSGVRLLAAPREFNRIASVTPKGVRKMLRMARGRFPYVVADLENVFAAEQVEAVWQADVIVFVLRLDYTSLRNARRAMDHLLELGLGLDRLRLVVNRYWQAKQLRVADAEAALGRKVAHLLPDEPARINRAVNAGIPVVLQKPSAKISKSLFELAGSVNGRPPRRHEEEQP